MVYEAVIKIAEGREVHFEIEDQQYVVEIQKNQDFHLVKKIYGVHGQQQLHGPNVGGKLRGEGCAMRFHQARGP